MDFNFVKTFGSHNLRENLASKLTVNCGLSYSAFKHRTSSSRFFSETCVSVGLVNWEFNNKVEIRMRMIKGEAKMLYGYIYAMSTTLDFFDKFCTWRVKASSSEQKVTFISLKALENIDPKTVLLMGLPFDFLGTATADFPFAASTMTDCRMPMIDITRKIETLIPPNFNHRDFAKGCTRRRCSWLGWNFGLLVL